MRAYVVLLVLWSLLSVCGVAEGKDRGARARKEAKRRRSREAKRRLEKNIRAAAMLGYKKENNAVDPVIYIFRAKRDFLQQYGIKYSGAEGFKKAWKDAELSLKPRPSLNGYVSDVPPPPRKRRKRRKRPSAAAPPKAATEKQGIVRRQKSASPRRSPSRVKARTGIDRSPKRSPIKEKSPPKNWSLVRPSDGPQDDEDEDEDGDSVGDAARNEGSEGHHVNNRSPSPSTTPNLQQVIAGGGQPPLNQQYPPNYPGGTPASTQYQPHQPPPPPPPQPVVGAGGEIIVPPPGYVSPYPPPSPPQGMLAGYVPPGGHAPPPEDDNRSEPDDEPFFNREGDDEFPVGEASPSRASSRSKDKGSGGASSSPPSSSTDIELRKQLKEQEARLDKMEKSKERRAKEDKTTTTTTSKTDSPPNWLGKPYMPGMFRTDDDRVELYRRRLEEQRKLGTLGPYGGPLNGGLYDGGQYGGYGLYGDGYPNLYEGGYDSNYYNEGRGLFGGDGLGFGGLRRHQGRGAGGIFGRGNWRGGYRRRGDVTFGDENYIIPESYEADRRGRLRPLRPWGVDSDDDDYYYDVDGPAYETDLSGGADTVLVTERRRVGTRPDGSPVYRKVRVRKNKYLVELEQGVLKESRAKREEVEKQNKRAVFGETVRIDADIREAISKIDEIDERLKTTTEEGTRQALLTRKVDLKILVDDLNNEKRDWEAKIQKR